MDLSIPTFVQISYYLDNLQVIHFQRCRVDSYLTNVNVLRAPFTLTYVQVHPRLEIM